MGKPPSTFDSITAAARLAGSRRFRTVVLAVAGIAWSALMAVSGWIGGKLELRYDIVELTKQHKTLTGQVEILTSQQRDLVRSVDALTDPPHGRLLVMDRELRYVRRDLVRSAAALYAGESSSMRSRKGKTAEEFGRAYDRLLEQGVAPSAAAETLLSQVAVP